MEFTVEKMIQAMEFEPDKKGRDRLYECFRIMCFYEFLDEKTWDEFNHTLCNEGGKNHGHA